MASPTRQDGTLHRVLDKKHGARRAANFSLLAKAFCRAQLWGPPGESPWGPSPCPPTALSISSSFWVRALRNSPCAALTASELQLV